MTIPTSSSLPPLAWTRAKITASKKPKRTQQVLLAAEPSGLLGAFCESDPNVPTLWVVTVHLPDGARRWNVVGSAEKAMEFAEAKRLAPPGVDADAVPRPGPQLVH